MSPELMTPSIVKTRQIDKPTYIFGLYVATTYCCSVHVGCCSYQRIKLKIINELTNEGYKALLGLKESANCQVNQSNVRNICLWYRIYASNAC